MILMIDNYDSFTYNVYQYIGSLYPQIQVVRNDEITIDEIRNIQNHSEKKFQSWESVWDIRRSEKYMAEKSFQQKN